jgi:hypothetical protein
MAIRSRNKSSHHICIVSGGMMVPGKKSKALETKDRTDMFMGKNNSKY